MVELQINTTYAENPKFFINKTGASIHSNYPCAGFNKVDDELEHYLVFKLRYFMEGLYNDAQRIDLALWELSKSTTLKQL